MKYKRTDKFFWHLYGTLMEECKVDVIFANKEFENLCNENTQMILWGNGFLGRTVYKEILGINSGINILFWDAKPDYKNSFLPYTLQSDDDKNKFLVIICIGNRIVAEQKKKECLEKGFYAILALDYGYEDSITKLSAIEFSLNMGCSLNCKYCPQDVLLRSWREKVNDNIQRHLTFSEFQKILDNELNPCSTISFSGMSEPFENPECADMLLYAYEHGFRILLNTTLMGMNESLLEKISNIHFEKIYLHIPDEEGMSHFNVSKEYVELLSKFINKFKDSIEHFSVHSANIDRRVKDIVLATGIPVHDASNFGDRAGNLEILNKNYNKEGQLFCYAGPLASYRAKVVMPSGKVVMCCNDYAVVGVGGNVVEQSWKEIIASKSYGKMQIGIDNEEWICRKCGCARNIKQTLEHYPDFAFEKTNCSYVYNITRNYKDMINETYRGFFEQKIYLAGVTDSKQSYYFFDNGWCEIFDVSAIVGETNFLGVEKIRDVPYVQLDSCNDKNILVMVLSDNEIEAEQWRKAGFGTVALFKDVAMSYLE